MVFSEGSRKQKSVTSFGQQGPVLDLEKATLRWESGAEVHELVGGRHPCRQHRGLVSKSVFFFKDNKCHLFRDVISNFTTQSALHMSVVRRGKSCLSSVVQVTPALTAV